ncbi:hypothetical protein [Peribacillus cavernae]|uniref:hypothetical protein n=1 Tax=Peribacillus cavernae TaxID=1674310 RepID=UPI0026C1350A|nr:hypothetical protein [Peribacillus cavernae]MDQ0219276.1 hypothetical protein [Peribacillus cavernae]
MAASKYVEGMLKTVIGSVFVMKVGNNFMNKGISYHAKDILLKSLSVLYQNDSLSVLHLDDMPKVKSLLPNEYARVAADEKRSDILFLLEDDSILMLEFESNRRYHQNYIKYLDYAYRILHRYYFDTKKVKKIRLVVVYTSDVTNVKDSLDAGDLQFQSKAVLLSEFGGDHILHQIRTSSKMARIKQRRIHEIKSASSHE